MKIVKWILIALGVVLVYKIFVRINFKMKEQANTNQPKARDADARTPGVIGNLFDSIRGAFNFGPNPSVPAIAGPYGFVGPQPVAGNDAYVGTTQELRVPSFLEGATGGVQDAAMTGTAPPPVAGVPPAPGSGAAYAPTAGGVGKGFRSLWKGMPLQNLNPFAAQKKGVPPSNATAFNKSTAIIAVNKLVN